MVNRLNTRQFLALRSIAREPWDLARWRLQWRFNRKWCHLFCKEGIRAQLNSVDGIGGTGGYGDVIDEAWSAAEDLEQCGLVEVFTVRCCQGTSCHNNDKHEYRLTPKGELLLQRANAANTSSTTTLGKFYGRGEGREESASSAND